MSQINNLAASLILKRWRHFLKRSFRFLNSLCKMIMLYYILFRHIFTYDFLIMSIQCSCHYHCLQKHLFKLHTFTTLTCAPTIPLPPKKLLPYMCIEPPLPRAHPVERPSKIYIIHERATQHLVPPEKWQFNCTVSTE